MTITDEKPAEVEFDSDFRDYVYDAYRHEDGSITYILSDSDNEHANPREEGETTACLVSENRDYLPLDDADDGIFEARKRFEDYDLTEVGLRKQYGSDLATFYWGRHALLQGRSKHNAEYMVRRYISICRPDIAHYEHSWSASGTSQGDYRAGWGYVTREALAEAGYSMNPERPLSGTYKMRAATIFEGELKAYQQYFAGEVFGAVHVTVGEPIVKIWDHGAYIDGWTTEEESVWGFLGYDDHKSIAREMTNSPITEVLA
jgi:hypothetical protein